MQALSQIFEMDPSELSRDTHFRDDLNANSLKLFMAMATMEELSGVAVTYRQLRECPTIGDAIDLLESLQKQLPQPHPG